MANSEITKHANNTVRKVVWTLTTSDPIGDAVPFPDFRDRCVSVTGTFGGGTVVLQGSNDEFVTGAFTLNDATGVDISVTSAAMFQVLESPEKVRPRINGSAGATVTVIMILGGTK